jgi:hypothetical protein
MRNIRVISSFRSKENLKSFSVYFAPIHHVSYVTPYVKSRGGPVTVVARFVDHHGQYIGQGTTHSAPAPCAY